MPTQRNEVSLARRRMQRLAMRATWFWRPLPDVVVLGAMKAGSTSVYAYLREHPDVRGSVRKEVHFLDMHADRGERWYRAQFPTRVFSQFTAVEATPMYLSWPSAPERFEALGHDAKFIVLLRDPVERAVSQWKHRTREGREDRTLGQVIEEESALTDSDIHDAVEAGIGTYQQLVLVHGHYAEQLRRWLARFDRSAFFIVDSAKLFQEPQRVVDAMLDFLELPGFTLEDAKPWNAGDERGATPAEMAALAAYYASRNAELFDLLGVTYQWRTPAGSQDDGRPNQ